MIETDFDSLFVFSGKCTLSVLHLQSTVTAYRIILSWKYKNTGTIIVIVYFP